MSVRVSVLQFAPAFGEPEENLRRIRGLLEPAETDLVILPELPFTGYSFRDRAELLDLSEDPARSPRVDGLAALCADGGYHVVTGFAERSGDRVYNSALLVGSGGVAGRYRKLHLFDREKELFDPGDLPMKVFRASGVRLGMMVCFDWIFPEAARTLALAGAEILCHPANLVLPYGQRTMVARCIENRVFAATANRTGTEDRGPGRLTFTGGSQVAAPGGELLVRAGETGQELLTAELDPGRARDKWITPRNHVLEDRRPEFYLGRTKDRAGCD